MKYLIKERPLSLYIHVPFCTSKCSYCAFYSIPGNAWDSDTLDAYTAVIIKQIHGINYEYGSSYKTVFIGGGNPGVLGIERLRKILEAATALGQPEEVTMEINPEEVTEELLTLKPMLTRVSVGIQSMSDDMLTMLGRNSRRKDNVKALSFLKDSGFNWNADIITAVPTFKPERTVEDIREVASYRPDHISFYCLSYEQGTPMFKKFDLRDEDNEVECLEKGWKALEELGYEHYEVSNFARDGHYAEHNIVYWELGQYIGLGPTAESSIGWNPVCSVRCNDETEKFLKSPELDFEPLDGNGTLIEYLMVALRTKWGVDKEKFTERFGFSWESVFGEAVKELPGEQYEDDEKSFRLTERGVMVMDSIILSLSLCCY